MSPLAVFDARIDELILLDSRLDTIARLNANERDLSLIAQLRDDNAQRIHELRLERRLEALKPYAKVMRVELVMPTEEAK